MITDIRDVRYRDWRDAVTCRGDKNSGHHPGETVTFCEATVRSLEQAGGTGQWLLAVKADHRRQESR